MLELSSFSTEYPLNGYRLSTEWVFELILNILATKMGSRNVGGMEEFDLASGDWKSYAARLDQYIVANSVTDDKQVATLLTVVGSDTYRLLENLVYPAAPKEKTYAELKRTLQGHLSPQPLVIAQRYRFHKRNQKDGESVASFLAELRSLARECEFGAALDEALRDKFVCGLRDEAIVKKLLTIDNLKLDSAFKQAKAFESATQEASLFGQSSLPVGSSSARVNQSESVHKLRARQARTGRSGSQMRDAAGARDTGTASSECSRCGRPDHKGSECPYRNIVCRYCSKRGHLRRQCRKRLADEQQSRMKPVPAPRSSRPVRKLDSAAVEPNSDEEFVGLHMLKSPGAAVLSQTRVQPIVVKPLVNGIELPMELDTGSAVSVISLATYQRLFGQTQLQKSRVHVTTYSGESLCVSGVFPVVVRYNNQETTQQLLVVDNDGPSLFGLDWLHNLRLDWSQLQRRAMSSLPVNTVKTVSEVERYQRKFPSLFQPGVGKLNGIIGHLELKEGAVPKFLKARPLPYALRPAVEAEINRLEAAGILKKVEHSTWATPIVPVVKANGSVRLCGDFKCTVNPQLHIPKYPLPWVEDVLASLGGGVSFTKLDLTQAYLHMEMDEESQEMLTLNTHRGLYRLTRLGFGVAAAPALWQRAMDTVLQGIKDTQCLLDDILVSGKTHADKMANLELTLERLERYGLRLNEGKCSFFQDKLSYLGHVISRDGIQTMPNKVQAVCDAPVPTTVSELRSFIGLVMYYHRFIPNLSTILHPLNRLLTKGVPFQWSTKEDEAFRRVKSCLVSADVLTHFRSDLPLLVACDASPYGLGAVLSHRMPDGTERPIAFASRTLSSAEKHYSQIDKEALAIYWSVKKFFSYLYGHHFILITDHKPLTSIFHPEKSLPALSLARLQRYAIFLSSLSYDIIFRRTSAHCNADALSRLPLHSAGQLVDRPDSIHKLHTAQLSPLPVQSSEIRRATARDTILSRVYQFTQHGWPRKVDDESLKPFFTRKDELTTHDGVLLWGMRVIVPSTLRKKILSELHSGHQGIVRTKQLARSYVWWPSLNADIEQLCKSCQGCSRTLPNPQKVSLHPWEWPSQPWERIHIDFAGPFLGSMWLLIVDAHSKWPEVVKMSQTTSTRVLAVLLDQFARFGLPVEVVSDNGPQFKSEEFESFLTSLGVQHRTSAPYHPSTNGQVERFVQTFKNSLLAMDSCLSVDERVFRFLTAYRNTRHATTNVSPAELLLGRSLRISLDQLRPSLQRRMCSKQTKEAERRYHKPREVAVGDTVSVRNYHGSTKWISGVVKKKLGALTYLVQVSSGQEWKRHIDQIRQYKGLEVLDDIDVSESVLESDVFQSTVEQDTIASVPSSMSSEKQADKSPIRSDQTDDGNVSTSPSKSTSSPQVTKRCRKRTSTPVPCPYALRSRSSK